MELRAKSNGVERTPTSCPSSGGWGAEAAVGVTLLCDQRKLWSGLVWLPRRWQHTRAPSRSAPLAKKVVGRLQAGSALAVWSVPYLLPVHFCCAASAPRTHACMYTELLLTGAARAPPIHVCVHALDGTACSSWPSSDRPCAAHSRRAAAASPRGCAPQLPAAWWCTWEPATVWLDAAWHGRALAVAMPAGQDVHGRGKAHACKAVWRPRWRFVSAEECCCCCCSARALCPSLHAAVASCRWRPLPAAAMQKLASRLHSVAAAACMQPASRMCAVAAASSDEAIEPAGSARSPRRGQTSRHRAMLRPCSPHRLQISAMGLPGAAGRLCIAARQGAADRRLQLQQPLPTGMAPASAVEVRAERLPCRCCLPRRQGSTAGRGASESRACHQGVTTAHTSPTSPSNVYCLLLGHLAHEASKLLALPLATDVRAQLQGGTGT